MFSLNGLAQLVGRVKGKKRTPPCSRRRNPVRLEVEALEGRELPAGGLGGSLPLVAVAAPTFTAPASLSTNTLPAFSWTATSGAILYDLWVSNVTTGQDQLIRNQTLTTNSYTPTTRLSAGSYQAWVRVTTGAGTSPWSATYSFTINPPAAPTLTAPTGSQPGMTPTFTWTASTDAVRYDLYVTNLTTGQDQIVRQQNLTTTSFTPASLLPMGSYQAWVRAFNNTGDASGWSATLNFSIAGPPAPTFSGPTGEIIDTNPTFGWSATSGATRYDLWVDNVSTGQTQIIRQQNLTTNSYTVPSNSGGGGGGAAAVPAASISGLPVGSYQAWVQAYSGTVALGSWSSTLKFSILPPAPPTLTGPPAVTTNTTPTFTWTASTGAVTYDIWVDNQTTGQTPFLRQTVTTTSFTPTTALPRGQYAYWVRAANKNGTYGNWSAGYKFLIDTTAPAIPTITAPVSPAATLTPTIAWSTSAGTSRYDLWVSDAATGQTQIRQQNLVASTYAPTTALAPGAYTAWVQAFDSTNQTRGWSPAYNFTLTQPVIPITVSAGANLSGNEGAAFAFTGSATGGSGALSYAWSFGDGGTASGTLTPSHVYKTHGSYTATLTVTDSMGTTASATTKATVVDVAPTVSAGGPYSGSPGTAVVFIPTVTVPDPTDTLSYLWGFGDGTASNQQAPSHTYANPGTYNVSLTVTDSGGLSSTATTTAAIAQNLPIVSAGPSKTGNEGTAIQFGGTASGGVGTLSYSWSFGDGGTASGSLTPSHTYLVHGNYTATLTVTDSLSHSVSSTTTVTVNDVAPAVNSGGPYSGKAGTAIQFTGSASSPNPTDTFSYSWTFGDGATSTQQSPTHIYTTAKTYNVTLAVTNAGGLSTTATTTAVVSANPITVSAGPSKSGNEGTAISFVGTASGGVGTLSYSWTFGDTGTATGTLTPSHTYLTHGSYTATLTVTDSQSNSASATTTVTVNDVAPTVNSGGPYSGKAGTAIQFTGSASSPNPTDTFGYSWNFGDGVTSTQQSPTHIYPTSKTYNVTLTVTNAGGLSTPATTTAVVSANPITVSAGPSKSGNEGTAILFAGTASGGVGTLSYSWTFGDGATANGTLTPSHTYLTHGSYTATLTVTDSQSNSASATTTVTVNNVAPTVTVGGPYSGSVGVSIKFTGTGSVPDPTDTLTYSWNFGDGGTSTQQSPSHSYASTGSYNVSLTVTNSGGLSASATTTATVSAGNAPFLNNSTPPPLPAPTGTVVNVSTVAALQSAVTNLQSGQTIVIAPGTYNLTAGLYIGNNSHVTNVGIRGATNNPGDVVLLGQGMDNSSGFGMGISVWNAQNVTIANLSIANVYFDDIELKGDQGADKITIYNCRLLDCGEQIIKADPNTTGGGVTNSSVQYCTIGYSVAPSTVDHGGGTGYTNGVDVHGGSGWLVSNNLFQNFHTPDNSANLWNPAVLFWNHSANNTVTGNTFINCDRAIALGLIERTTGFDNQGGLIANNFVYMAPGEYSATRQAGADAPIIAWDSPGTVIAFNTILTSGNTPNSIQVRFAETTNVYVQDNLADATVRSRDGAVYVASENYWTAATSMFANAAIGDLHLVSNSTTQANVIGKASSPASVTTDYDGQARTTPTDIGADQYSAADSPLVVTAGPTQTGNEGTAVQFSGTASGGSGTLSYSWNFGDGSTATGSLSPSHTYLTRGTYTATLTVTDTAGHTSSNTTTVTVNDVVPTVNIGGPYLGLSGSAIKFTATATAPDPTDTLTYAWNFGDGSTSTQQNPSHTYASSGTFNVSLTVTDSGGMSTTATTTATATTGPAVGSLTVSPSTVTAGGSITLTVANVTDNAGTVTLVSFYISALGGSTVHSPMDTLLGNGAQGTTPATNQTWTLTVSTTGLAPGAYTIFAQAGDSNSQLSLPVAVTLTVQ
jgi:PKD repeat protein